MSFGEGPPAFEDLDAVRERVAARLSSVGRVVFVMSGKGGVGKSAVAVNLARTLAARGHRVGLLDADLQGPSVGMMLGLRGRPVGIRADGTLRPLASEDGLVVQSMDFFLQGNQALDWDGPDGEGATLRSAFEQAALGDLLGQTDWGELDYLVADLAPGADRLLSVRQLVPAGVGEALGVTIPTRVALLAVDRSLRRAREAAIPLIGLVENMGTRVCGKCGAEESVFREAPAEELARQLDVPLVARIPFDPGLAEAADRGEPYAGAASAALSQLAEAVEAYEAPGPEGESW